MTRFIVGAGLAAILVAHAAAAQQTKIPLAIVLPGSDRVLLVPNGDFQQLGSPVGNAFPNPLGWVRSGEMYVANGSNVVAADQGIVAQGLVGQANLAEGYVRSLTLQPDTEYVLSAYLWNLGDASNHVTTVVDLNDASNEGQLTLYANDPAADRGYLVYTRFNTSTTGTNILLRCFYDGFAGRGAAPRYYPVGAQWDNIAITRADLFPAPPRNAALSGTASQSSTGFGGLASRAIDGNTEGDYGGNSVTHNQPPEDGAWWEVDLGAMTPIDRICNWWRTDCCFERQDDFTLLVLDGSRREVFRETYPGRPPFPVYCRNFTPIVTGRIVRLEARVPRIGDGSFSLAEVQVFEGDPAKMATQYNFNDCMVPPGTSFPGAGNIGRIAGDGAGNNCVVHLTDVNQGGAFGAFLIPAPAGGSNVDNIHLHWRSLVGGDNGSVCTAAQFNRPGADGYSLSWGTDLPNPPSYGNPGEEGAGSGLIVTVDTFDNGGGEAPGLEIKWRGVRVAFDNINSDPGLAKDFLRKGVFVEADLAVDTAGHATLTYDGRILTATLAHWTGIAGGGCIMFGARTGGACDNHWIDDLLIERHRPGRLTLGIDWLANSQARICWPDPSMGFVLQCATNLNAPILWRELTLPVATINGKKSVMIDTRGSSTFYRLINTLGMGEPVYSIWPDGSVSFAVPIRNASDVSVSDVEVLSISLRGASRLAPGSFPVALGEINPKASGVTRARFSVPIIDGRSYLLTVTGRYRYGSGIYELSLDRFVPIALPATGPFMSHTTAPIKWTASSARDLFGPAKTNVTGIEFESVESGPLPLGPDREVFPRTSPPTGVQNAVAAGAEQFVRLTVDTQSGTRPSGIPPDPNAAADSRLEGNSGVALITYNTSIGVSTDRGRTFTIFNPKAINDPGNPARTTMFPEDDGGLCCDQLVTYVPNPNNQNIFVWVLQYSQSSSVAPGTVNRIRVAWATPESIKSDFINAWTWVDLTSAALGFGNDWFDQPDVSYSDSFVFLSMSHGLATGGGSPNRRMMVRLSLADMLNPAGGPVSVGYFEPLRNNLCKTRFIQNSRDAMRWATMDDPSTLILYEWSDSSSTIPSPSSVAVTTIDRTDFSSADPSGPPGVQWLGSGENSLGGVRGSTYTLSPLVRIYDLATDSGRQPGSGRPHPYVRVETIAQITSGAFTSRTVTKEFDVWNGNHGYALAELTHGQTGRVDPDLAITITAGGGTLYPRYCVGFLGDFVVYWVADNNATESFYAYVVDTDGNVVKDAAGNPIFQKDSAGNKIILARYGDYSSARLSGPAPRANNLFSTLVYQVTTPTPGREACASGNCTTTPHYVEWGRPEDF